MPRSTVCLTFDFDAMSVWFGYEHVTPAMLQRGEYGARVGVPRLLQMLERHELPATFFVPGHTLESFPAPSQRDRRRPATRSRTTPTRTSTPAGSRPTTERADIERALAALERLGVQPLGYRSPSADLSASDAEAARGARLPLRLEPDGRRLPAHTDRGSATVSVAAGRRSSAAARRDLWEIPMCFELDDWPHFQFNFDPSRVGLSAPSKVLEIWQGELDCMHEHVDGGVLVVAMHPQVIGRGHRVAMLERFVEHARGLGAEFAQMGEVAQRGGARPLISASICSSTENICDMSPPVISSR